MVIIKDVVYQFIDKEMMEKIKNMPIEIRGHHLQRLYDYITKGSAFYDRKYGRAYRRTEKKVFDLILQGSTFVKIIDKLDDTCRLCKKQKQSCLDIEIAREDAYFANIAGLDIGEVYAARIVLESIEHGTNFATLMTYQRDRLFDELYKIYYPKWFGV